jgi:putative ABC transport system permease protein
MEDQSMESLFQDVRYGLRVLRKNVVVTAVSILLLALGVGANTAIFSIVNAVLLRRPAYAEPERLAFVWGTTPQVARTPVSAPDLLDYRERTTGFEGMAAFAGGEVVVHQGAGEPERVRCGRATPEFFTVLGVRPILGRGLAAGEGQAGGAGVIVLSHGFWRARFASSKDVLDQKITINGKPYSVIGVLPPKFEFEVPGFFRPVEMWTGLDLPRDASRSNHNLRVIARLKPGVALGRAQEDLSRIAADLAREYPSSNAGVGARVVSWRDQVAGPLRPALRVLLGAVGLVLLIVCANVASLQLGKTSLRQREMALRLSLGASRGRIVVQLVTESMVMALAGGVLGIALAIAGIGALQRAFPDRIPVTAGGLLDVPVLVFALIVTLGTGVLFGVAPALQASSTSLVTALQESARGASGGAGSARLRDALVVAELALSLVLIMGAGLLIASFVRVLQVRSGFAPDDVLVATIQLPNYAYRDDPGRLAFYQQAFDRVRALPGVEAAGGIDDLPLTPDRDADAFVVEGAPEVARNELPVAQIRSVTPDYFRTLRIPLLRGREFTELDTASGLPVILINQTLARRFFPEADPVGKRLRFAGEREDWMTIAGVVGDVRSLGLEVPPEPEIYRSYSQRTLPYLSLVVHTSTHPASVIGSLRGALHELNGSLPVFGVQSMNEVVAAALAERRFNMLLVSIFGAVALVLAAVGIYGVVAYWAMQRTREIGIRMALGAQSADIFKLVIGRAAILSLVGVVAGIGLWLGAMGALSALVFEAGTIDPPVAVLVVSILTTTAMAACWVPARRATRVDPVVALRQE